MQTDGNTCADTGFDDVCERAVQEAKDFGRQEGLRLTCERKTRRPYFDGRLGSPGECLGAKAHADVRHEKLYRK